MAYKNWAIVFKINNLFYKNIKKMMISALKYFAVLPLIIIQFKE